MDCDAVLPPPPFPPPSPLLRPWHLWPPRVSRRGAHCRSLCSSRPTAGLPAGPAAGGAPPRGETLFLSPSPSGGRGRPLLLPRRRARPGRPEGVCGGGSSRCSHTLPPPPPSSAPPALIFACEVWHPRSSVFPLPAPPPLSAHGRCLGAPRCGGRFLGESPLSSHTYTSTHANAAPCSSSRARGLGEASGWIFPARPPFSPEGGGV